MPDSAQLLDLTAPPNPAGDSRTARRSEMEARTRGRLLDAVIGELAQDGYERVDLGRAIAAVGADPAEAAVEFPDKDTCLFAGYERLSSRLLGAAVRACDAAASEGWEQRVGAGLAAVLRRLAAEPRMTRVLTHTFPAIGPAARERYQALLDRFAEALSDGRRAAGATDALPAAIELLAVGAAETIVFAEVEAGRTRQLPGMHPEILFSLLVPFLGPQRAAAAMEDARRRS